MEGNFLFITGCYPKEFNEYYIVNSKVMPQNAANVLSWRIIEGLEENIPKQFHVLTCPFIGYYPKGFKRVLIRDKKWSHNQKDEDFQLGFINIKGLETFIKSERIFKYVEQWYKESLKNRNIIFYSHYAGFMRAIGKIKKDMPDIKIICLVTDMNEMDERKDLEGIKGKIKGIPRALMINTTYKNLKYVDAFVLLAEEMKKYLGIGEKPYVVVEGIANGKIESKVKEKSICHSEREKFKVVYTGTMHKRYGSVMLAEAIKTLEKYKNIELYICGSGDGEKEVEKISKQSSNVYFLGILSHEEALKLQSEADLLVNSMPNFGIHTKLSFPSKTMEYMIMGKPVVCFKVEGIPKEYDNYLMYFDEATVDSVAKKILDISKLEKKVLQDIGEKNRKFVMEKKNSKIQVKKIIDLFSKI